MPFHTPYTTKKTFQKSPKSLFSFRSRRPALRFPGYFSKPRAQKSPINNSHSNRHIYHIHQNGRAATQRNLDHEGRVPRNNHPGLDEDSEEDDFGDSFFPWEEEDTLFSDLMDELPQEEEDIHLSRLAESLQAGFDHEGRQLKKEIADTFVPTVNRVKKLYRGIDEQVDLSFRQGLVLFDTACKDSETTAERDQEAFQHTYNHQCDKIKDLYAQLEEAYATRARLAVEFEAALDAIIDPAQEVLKGCPQTYDRTIMHLEKQSKVLEKTDSELTEKKMKGLLSKLV